MRRRRQRQRQRQRRQEKQQRLFRKKTLWLAINSCLFLGKPRIVFILNKYRSSKDDSSKTVPLNIYDDLHAKIISMIQMSVANDDIEI